MKAVFLDRDGTINHDPGYISDPDKLLLLPGVASALARLKAGGFELIVISNQSGVGRGLFPVEALGPVHARMNELLAAEGVRIHHIYYCTHHPKEDCECRKPKPKLIRDAARDLGVDLSRSYMVGDKGTDLEAGRAAGLHAVALVRTGYGAETERSLPDGGADFIGEDLSEVAGWILGRESS